MPLLDIFPFCLPLSLLSPFSFPSITFTQWCSYILQAICLSCPGMVSSSHLVQNSVRDFRGSEITAALVSSSSQPAILWECGHYSGCLMIHIT